MIWSTSKYFHKTFVRAGGYSLEFDTNADPHYDANGLGSIQRNGAPSTICLAMPFAEHPNYGLLDYENKSSFSICPAVKKGEWVFAADQEAAYSLTDSKINGEECEASFACAFAGDKVDFCSSVSEKGVCLKISSDASEEIGIALPVFDFDGESHTKVTEGNNKISVEYNGWVCEYESDSISKLQTNFANRNGVYKGYIAEGVGDVTVRIKIYEKN